MCRKRLILFTYLWRLAERFPMACVSVVEGGHAHPFHLRGGGTDFGCSVQQIHDRKDTYP